MKINYLTEWEDSLDSNINTIGDYINKANSEEGVKTDISQDFINSYNTLLSNNIKEILKEMSISNNMYETIFLNIRNTSNYRSSNELDVQSSFFGSCMVDEEDIKYDDIEIDFNNNTIIWKLNIEDTYLPWARSSNNVSYNSFKLFCGYNVKHLKNIEEHFSTILNNELTSRSSKVKYLSNIPIFKIKLLFKFTDLALSYGSINAFNISFKGGSILTEEIENIVYILNSIEIADIHNNIISGLFLTSAQPGNNNDPISIDLKPFNNIKFKFKIISLDYINVINKTEAVVLNLLDYSEDNLFLTYDHYNMDNISATNRNDESFNEIFYSYKKSNNLYILFNLSVQDLTYNTKFRNAEDLRVLPNQNIFLWDTYRGEEYHINSLISKKLYNR